MDRTSSHRLPYVAADQAQKHVTVNEGLRMIDALLGASARSASLVGQPASPEDGEAYILPTGASGAAWDALAANTLAVFQDGAWAAFPPSVGLSVFVEDEGSSRVWNGTAWVRQEGGLADSAPRLGVNADADATNRFVVKSDAILHSHDDQAPGTGDARHVLNKATPGNTASFVFQTGYGGRAEIGLTGSDDFAFKVSPDGATWFTALTIDRSTGAVSLPNTQVPSDPVHEVWAVLGQSNAVGRAVNENAYAHAGEAYQYDQAGTLVPATEPLDHVDPAAGDVGLDVGFASTWLAAAPAGSTLTFVPCAAGGTGFSDARWNPGDDLYEAAVSRTDAALAAVRAARGTARLGGFLWLQGEKDATFGTDAYRTALDAMIAKLRADVAEADARTPFVLAPMTPEYAASFNAATQIDGVHRDTPARVAYTALASNAGTAGMVGETIHYDDASIVLIGERMHAAIPSARGNAPGLPGQVTGLVAQAGGDGEVVLTFDAASANRATVTDYVIEVDGAIYTDGISAATTATVAGLEAGSTVSFRVAGVNAVGQGPWSDAATGTAGGAVSSGAHPYPAALGFWRFGDDNAGMEEFGGGRPLTLKADAPTHAAGHAVLAASNKNGLLSDIGEPGTYTEWAVVRLPTDANQLVMGAIGAFGTQGGGLFVNARKFFAQFRDNPTLGSDLGTIGALNEWVFLAVTLDAATGAYRYYVGDANTPSEVAGTGTRAAPADAPKLAIGNAHGGSTSYTAAFDVAEFGVLPDASDRAALDALYAEAVSRQAARGNVVR